MACTCVVGLQWGDEAKGKIVDLLTDQHDFVVRYNGGANAGHTVVQRRPDLQALPAADRRPPPQRHVGDRQRRRRLPAALPRRSRQPARRPASTSAATSSSATTPTSSSPTTWKKNASTRRARNRPSAPPAAASAPATRTRSAGSPASASASCCTPTTCASGCAPIVPRKNRMLRGLSPDAKQFDADALCDEYLGYADRCGRSSPTPRGCCTRRLSAGKRHPVRGGPGQPARRRPRHLSLRHQLEQLAGRRLERLRRAARNLDRVIGVIKAYTTRVGRGPFPTELNDGPDGIGERIRQTGREYGTVTGRPRRCGWFDAVAVRYTAALGGADELAVMLLDVLSGLDELKHLHGLRTGRQAPRSLPQRRVSAGALQAGLRDAAGLAAGRRAARRKLADLPAAARRYVDRLSELIELPVIASSRSGRTGTRRSICVNRRAGVRRLPATSTFNPDTLQRLAEAGLDPRGCRTHRRHHGRQRPLGAAARPAAHRGPCAAASHSVRATVEECCRLGVGQLTLYCLSSRELEAAQDGTRFPDGAAPSSI